MLHTFNYTLLEVAPYINWVYFFHAWGLSGKPQQEKDRLQAEAELMLKDMDQQFHTHAIVGLFDANADGDDIIIDGQRLPMLRQQKPSAPGQPNLCLADFIRPIEQGIPDRIGVFAATVDRSMEMLFADDAYHRMMVQTLADRLAEATIEKVHAEVRRTLWGYAPHEQLSIQEMLVEHFQGIRPAVGYPSLPDTSVNFLLSDLIGMKQIGIHLTETGMMQPHASVSGFMFAHPKARYFDLGKIGEDQLRDYARRRGVPVELMRRFLSGSLLKRG